MRQPIIPYRPDLTERAHSLRRKMTLAEVLLWNQLKRKQLCGYDFDRQRPLRQRIVDFYCKELNLAVDADGSVHDHLREQDERRHKEIETLGVTHLRFWELRGEERHGFGAETNRGLHSGRGDQARLAEAGSAGVCVAKSCDAGRKIGAKVNSGEPTPDPSKEGNCTS